MWTAVAAIAGIVFGAAGWAVVGRQAVTQKVVADRRKAFTALILEADRKQANPNFDGTALKEAITTADLVCSVSMRESGRVPRIEDQVERGIWADERTMFITVARLESIHGSAVVRWRKRHWYTNLGLNIIR